MPGYVQVFGGTPIRSTDESYILYSTITDITLEWPTIIAQTTNPATQIIDVNPLVGGLSVFMPPANQTTLPSPILLHNVGSFTFTARNNAGGQIAVIDPGDAWFLFLTLNINAAGSWTAIQFGASTSNANAATLAGYGLIPITNTLNVNHPIVDLAVNTVLDETYRARIINWTGGAGVITLPDTATVNIGTGYFFGIHNSGTGHVTFTPVGSGTIDGMLQVVVAPGESCMIFSMVGNIWVTVGLGRSNVFSFSQLNRDVSGNVDVNLFAGEAGNFIIRFFGILTGNISVIFPNVVAPYIIYNNTTGAFGLTARTAAGTGLPIPQGQRVFVYNDGNDIADADTVVPTVTGLFADGNVLTPSISFQAAPDTGFYRTAGAIRAAMGGVNVARINVDGISSIDNALLYDRFDMFVMSLIR